MSGKVVSRVDGGDHAVDGEEGGQVGRVRRDQDQGEKPPDAACNNARVVWSDGEDDLICRHLIGCHLICTLAVDIGVNGRMMKIERLCGGR